MDELFTVLQIKRLQGCCAAGDMGWHGLCPLGSSHGRVISHQRSNVMKHFQK